MEYTIVDEVIEPRTDRKKWALDVLEIAKANPDKWIRLDKPAKQSYASKYLRPLGLLSITRNIDKPTNTGTIYVMWPNVTK